MSVRKTYAPYSVSGENVAQTPLEGFIEVEQKIIPTIETGFVDENGSWIGNLSSDKEFITFQTDEAIANAGTIITPSISPDGTWPLDMTGYCDIALAIKVTRTGNYGINAVMGPDSLSYANLDPVEAGITIQIIDVGSGNDTSFYAALQDAATAMDNANVWKILMIKDRLNNQKLLQFQITNNSGGISTIETAFMRLV